LLQDRPRIILEEGRELRIRIPCAQHGLLVDVQGFARQWRNEGAWFLQLDVALAGLLRVVERVGVQDAPDELPRHVLEPELEMRVLEDGMVPAFEGQRPDGVALLLGHLLPRNDARRVAGAGGRNGAVVRRLRCTQEGNAWRRGGQRQSRHGTNSITGRGTSRLWALGTGPQALGSGLWDLGFGLWALGSGLWALGFGLWARLQALGFRL